MLTLFHPRHARGAVAVGIGVADGNKVGARQVVIRQGFQIEVVVGLVSVTHCPRGVVERVANEKMWA
ncbi:hypothetical protein D9M71_773770 [compost metagenome]